MNNAARQEESVAHGARWITVAFMIVGLLNYGYALLLTHLLDVAAYSEFAAGQGLILWASTVAIVCVPWMLAQALAHARSDGERNAATGFAKVVSAGSGLTAAVVVGGIATRFASPFTVLTLALSTFVIFLGTTTTGWLQGRERMRVLSGLYVAENLLKNCSGVLLVVVARLGDAGALAAFGIGGIVMLPWWPRTPRPAGRVWLAAAANWHLWRRAARIAAAQGMVSLFAAIDVVLVALLPGDRALAASYQASATLSRVPLFIAGALATAFFPSLSRGASARLLAARAMRMYAVVALPLAAILMTIPARVLAAVFPAEYSAVDSLLKYTAVIGLAAGAIGLITAFFQAADDYSCLWWLGAGLAGYGGALLTGWRVGGITGLAAGGALGAASALILMGYRLLRRQGRGVLAGVPVAEPLIVAAVLVVLRPYPLLWLAAAAGVGMRAGTRFLRTGARQRPGDRRRPGIRRRPGARHARSPAWAQSVDRAATDPPTVRRPAAARHVVISSFDNAASSHYNGGGAAVVEMIAERLAAYFEVTVVTAARRGGTTEREGVRYQKLPVGWAGPRGGQLVYHALLPFAARRIRHDLWIENFTPPYSTSFLPLFSRARVVGLAQSLAGKQMWRRYRIPCHLVERWGLRCYRDVVVLNSADGEAVRSSSPSAALRVIPNGIEKRPLNEQLLGRGEHILFLGRIDIWEKGLDLLLAAYERSGAAMPLLVAGSGLPREERRLSALLATSSNVRWLGHVTGQHKQDLLERSAFVMLPSRAEAFGLVALEGMSCGKPVLHFDLPTLRWMDGDVRVPPFSVDALAGEMRALDGDEAARRALGRTAHTAAQRYGRDETADRYLALVQELLGAPGRGGGSAENGPASP